MTSDGIRYSNIEPDHESSTGPQDVPPSRRPRLNQCETRYVALCNREQARETRLRREQVVVAGVELRILDSIADREQPPLRIEQKVELHLREQTLRRAAPRASILRAVARPAVRAPAAAARSAPDSAGRSGIVSSPASSATLMSSAMVHAAGPPLRLRGVARAVQRSRQQRLRVLSSERESSTKRSMAVASSPLSLAVQQPADPVREARGTTLCALQRLVSLERITNGARQLVLHLIDGKTQRLQCRRRLVQRALESLELSRDLHGGRVHALTRIAPQTRDVASPRAAPA